MREPEYLLTEFEEDGVFSGVGGSWKKMTVYGDSREVITIKVEEETLPM